MLAVGLMGAMIAQFVPLIWALGITAWMVVVVGYILAQRLRHVYNWFESRFLKNLQEDNFPIIIRPKKALAPWDAHLTEFTVPPEAAYVGKPLADLMLRERFGITIALIERGRLQLTAPGRHVALMPFDRLHVIGTDEQLLVFKGFIELSGEVTTEPAHEADYILEQYQLTSTCPYIEKTIRESLIREHAKGLVVGLERGGQRILNPDSKEFLKAGDILWIAGDREKLVDLLAKIEMPEKV